MNKKVMAVAVAAALAAPATALAQITLQGRFVAEYGFASQMDVSDTVSRDSADGFNSPASWLRFSSEEKLGGGNSIWAQCEVRARWGVDTNPSQSAGGFCDRNSALGIKGSFGNFYVGRWDTAIEDNSGLTRITGSTGWDGRQHMLTEDQSGFISFAQRVQNSFNYKSPNFNGFQVDLSTTSSGAALNTPSSNTGLDGRIYSILAKYASGPLVAYVGYEKHEDNQTVAAGGGAGADGLSEDMTTLGVSYVFGPVKVGIVYTSFEGDISSSEKLERDSWQIAGEWKVTPAGTVRVAYTEAGEYEGSGAVTATGFAGDTGAKQYSLGYYHALSKRTTVGAYYTKVDNDTNGTYNYHSFNDAVRPGDSSGAFVLHAAHNF
jgi:predicted porin